MLDMTEENIIPEGYKLCECTKCGQLIPIVDRRGRIRHFVKGHRFIYAQRGSTHFNWKGGRTFSGTYIRLNMPEHPRANHKGWVYEHIVIMEKKLGRNILPGEVVHHKNKNKLDNSPENLELITNNSEHIRMHMREVWAAFKNRASSQ